MHLSQLLWEVIRVFSQTFKGFRSTKMLKDPCSKQHYQDVTFNLYAKPCNSRAVNALTVELHALLMLCTCRSS
jgi:hypothetical protein